MWDLPLRIESGSIGGHYSSGSPGVLGYDYEVPYHLEDSMVVLCRLEVFTEVPFHLENFTPAPAPLVDFTEVL